MRGKFMCTTELPLVRAASNYIKSTAMCRIITTTAILTVALFAMVVSKGFTVKDMGSAWDDYGLRVIGYG